MVCFIWSVLYGLFYNKLHNIFIIKQTKNRQCKTDKKQMLIGKGINIINIVRKVT
jgi:hypothetical protein